jgi:hypothetical protein
MNKSSAAIMLLLGLTQAVDLSTNLGLQSETGSASTPSIYANKCKGAIQRVQETTMSEATILGIANGN